MADQACSGIYEIVNLVNRKRYVGSAVNIRQRWREHRSHLKSGRHHSRHLLNAWRKYGAEVFSFQIIELCSKEDLLAREQAEFDREWPAYNICPTAGSTLGRVHTAEAKAKIGNRLRGGRRDPEVVASVAAQLRGRKKPPEHSTHLLGNKFAKGCRHTDEWKAANSTLHTGRKRPKSLEYRAKIAATLRARSQSQEIRDRLRVQAAMAWQSRTEEDCKRHMEKVRAARGPITDEQRRQISERQVGRPMHPNALAALRDANLGRRLSEDHRQKIGAASLRAWTPERKLKHAAAIRAAHARKKAATG